MRSRPTTNACDPCPRLQHNRLSCQERFAPLRAAPARHRNGRFDRVVARSAGRELLLARHLQGGLRLVAGELGMGKACPALLQRRLPVGECALSGEAAGVFRCQQDLQLLDLRLKRGRFGGGGVT